jgi:hypothetical protein
VEDSRARANLLRLRRALRDPAEADPTVIDSVGDLVEDPESDEAALHWDERAWNR